jgi:hypothetical protein
MAGAPLGTRTAAKQSESKSKLMPNLFESRGLRRLWASHELTGSYSGPEVRSEETGPYGAQFALRSPRTPFQASNEHLYEYATNQELARRLLITCDKAILDITSGYFQTPAQGCSGLREIEKLSAWRTSGRKAAWGR